MEKTHRRKQHKLCVLTQTLRRESMMKNHARRTFDRTNDDSACQRTIKRLKRDVADAESGADLPDKKHVTLLANQTFTNEVRECVLELSSLEVDAGKVGPVIHTVAIHFYQEDRDSAKVPEHGRRRVTVSCETLLFQSYNR